MSESYYKLIYPIWNWWNIKCIVHEGEMVQIGQIHLWMCECSLSNNNVLLFSASLRTSCWPAALLWVTLRSWTLVCPGWSAVTRSSERLWEHRSMLVGLLEPCTNFWSYLIDMIIGMFLLIFSAPEILNYEPISTATDMW